MDATGGLRPRVGERGLELRAPGRGRLDGARDGRQHGVPLGDLDGQSLDLRPHVALDELQPLGLRIVTRAVLQVLLHLLGVTSLVLQAAAQLLERPLLLDEQRLELHDLRRGLGVDGGDVEPRLVRGQHALTGRELQLALEQDLLVLADQAVRLVAHAGLELLLRGGRLQPVDGPAQAARRPGGLAEPLQAGGDVGFAHWC
jgi:hypothetical protein